ncbi:MAG: crotonase/enoyl-CoA hydratase family protein [Solirubrobacterales bacterium]|nr:crotonase/enoyl-CoA hydratase family protein [Solirubrobacterales bacterium]MCB8971147.1 crotonase/enoyl-CoA hydratase family protein [Thermoleophilales bacterium]MCO5325997.1 crotonase/enoyl-CoA hydratase family protein [Solirubrobacterales bacterium]
MGLTTYELSDGIATIRIDDGKVNALSETMLAEISARFDEAERDEAVVILTGRERIFSAGFDLRTEGEGWPPMLVAGARLAERMLSFPRPVVAACNGSAIAMGSFLLLSADHRIGADADLKLGLNEVAIGLTLPWFAIELARHRLPRPWFDRCTVTGVMIGPEEGVAAGFLDELVPPEELEERALGAARVLAGINHDAHLATKLRVRSEVLDGVRDGIARIEGDGRDW